MVSRFGSWSLALALCFSALSTSAVRADGASVALALEAQLQALESQPATVRGLSIAWPQLLHEFYALRGFRPVWDRGAAVADLLRAIRASHDDGLDPEDYYLTPLTSLQRELGGSEVGDTARAAFDVLGSEALLRLCYHLRFGKVDPSAFDPQWNYGRPLPPDARIVELLGKLVDAPDLFDRVEALKPSHYLYVALKRELGRYRRLAEAGGWRPLAAGASLSTLR